jgi:hypothetical protein
LGERAVGGLRKGALGGGCTPQKKLETTKPTTAARWTIETMLLSVLL